MESISLTVSECVRHDHRRVSTFPGELRREVFEAERACEVARHAGEAELRGYAVPSGAWDREKSATPPDRFLW